MPKIVRRPPTASEAPENGTEDVSAAPPTLTEDAILPAKLTTHYCQFKVTLQWSGDTIREVVGIADELLHEFDNAVDRVWPHKAEVAEVRRGFIVPGQARIASLDAGEFATHKPAQEMVLEPPKPAEKETKSPKGRKIVRRPS